MKRLLSIVLLFLILTPTTVLADSGYVAVEGAVYDDGGSQTTETTDANSPTINDVYLLPATPAVNDAFYFGGSVQFDSLKIRYDTAGAGVWTILWEYYDGDSWEELDGIVDETDGFREAADTYYVSFDLPGDWTEVAVNTITSYWVRARVAAYTSITTRPNGTQFWVNQLWPLPQKLEVEDVKVLTNILETGDQLYLIRYYAVYEDVPLGNAKEFYTFSLYEDGSTLSAKISLPAWGYKPTAIYIESEVALEWGSSHTVEIEGVAGKVTSSFSDTYTLSTADYLGSDLEWLDDWILESSYRFEEYYSVDFLEDFSGVTVLSSTGSAVFSRGIPGLPDIRPSMYGLVSRDPDVSTREFSTDYEDSLSDNMGTALPDIMDRLGTFVGTGGGYLSGAVWVLLLVLVAGLVGARTGSSTASIVIALPIFFIGVYLGAIPLALMAIIGTGCAAYLIYSIWLKGT